MQLALPLFPLIGTTVHSPGLKSCSSIGKKRSACICSGVPFNCICAAIPFNFRNHTVGTTPFSFNCSTSHFPGLENCSNTHSVRALHMTRARQLFNTTGTGSSVNNLLQLPYNKRKKSARKHRRLQCVQAVSRQRKMCTLP